MHTQKLTYTNRTQSRLRIILEPWAEEYWLDPGEHVDIEGRSESPGSLVQEIEHASEGPIIYGSEGSVVLILGDGNELPPTPTPTR